MLKNLKAAAIAAQERGDQTAALSIYRRLASINPADQTSDAFVKEIEKEQAIGTALSHLQNREFERAIVEISGALSLYPGEKRLVEGLRLAQGRREKNQADKLMKIHSYHEALRYYNQALRFIPEERAAIDGQIAEIRLRTGLDYRSDGVVHARGTVTGPAKIKITANTVTYLEGQENIQLKLGLEKLPPRPYMVKIERIDGDANIQIVETPYRGNNYAVTLQILPKNERKLNFDLSWELQKTGRVDWRGKVNGTALIRLQGQFIDTSGNVGDVVASCDPLPHEFYQLSIAKIQGDLGVATRIIERPSAANDYAATIEIKADGDNVALSIDWNITR
jgi:tetratricopeptide (TPR) repeat protein